MMKNNRGNSMVEMIMVMMLIMIFGVCVFTMIYSGSNAQTNMTGMIDEQADARIALAHFNMLIRKFDGDDVSVVKINETGENGVMAVKTEPDSLETYAFWYFVKDNVVYQYIGSPGDEPSSDMSLDIFKMSADLSISYDEETRSITNTVTYKYGEGVREMSATISLRSGSLADKGADE